MQNDGKRKIPATRYRENAQQYGVIYNSQAPYNIIESQDFSREEIAFLHKFTHLPLYPLSNAQLVYMADNVIDCIHEMEI